MQTTDLIFIILSIIAGWVAGWVVNYLADVLPVTRRLSRPACPECHKPYGWIDHFLLRGCKSCGRSRSMRTLVVQAVLTVGSVLIVLFPPRFLSYPAGLLLLIYLSVVFVIDMEHRVILHPVSLAGIALGLVVGIPLHGVITTLIGGIFGFGVMLLFYYVGVFYIRYMAKRRKMPTNEEALGFGDVSFSGVLGLLLGWPSIVVGLIFAVVVGGLVSLIIILKMLITKSYKAFTAIPYAPFLVLSALILFIRG